ncbi:Ig-like domain-containing protein [Aliivibrio sp. SR45-2]|uniref:Ig-like domain-containing protein n=1 Tax=Aliivibrio sp. SR45-2 TaxID=2760931 RepID=UPI0015F9266E|nr:Ig-like domain-containing protein [Aliivibrio sp. SR45-2]MBB1313413.1 cadherin-like domain-containing protein [Aliivibrio sp. SR45-2]
MKKNILSASILAALTLTGCNSSDSSSDSSITAPIIKPANSIPVAKHDIALVGQFDGSQNQVIDVDVLANDSDADNDNLIIIEAKAAYGDVQIESNQISYRGIEKTPSGRDVISYTIEDSNGAIASSSVSVFAAPDNDNGFGQNPDKGNDNGFGQDVIDPNNDNGFGQNPDQGSDNGFSYDMPLQTESFNLQLRANEAFDLTKAILAHVGSKTASIADVSARLGKADVMQSDKGSMSLRAVYKYDRENHDGIQDTVIYAVEDKFGNVGINTINIDIVETPDIDVPIVGRPDIDVPIVGRPDIDVPQMDSVFDIKDHKTSDIETPEGVSIYKISIGEKYKGWAVDPTVGKNGINAIYGTAYLASKSMPLDYFYYAQSAEHVLSEKVTDVAILRIINPKNLETKTITIQLKDSEIHTWDGHEKPTVAPKKALFSYDSPSSEKDVDGSTMYDFAMIQPDPKFVINTFCMRADSDSDCEELIPVKVINTGTNYLYSFSAKQLTDGYELLVQSGYQRGNNDDYQNTNLDSVTESDILTIGVDVHIVRTIDTNAAAEPMHDAMAAAASDPAVEDVLEKAFNSDGSLVDDVKFETYGGTSIIRAKNHLSGAPRTDADKYDYQKVTVMTPNGKVKVFTGDDFIVSKDGSTMVYLHDNLTCSTTNMDDCALVNIVDLTSDNPTPSSISDLEKSVVSIPVGKDGNYLPQGSFGKEAQVSFEATSRLHISDDGKYVAYFLADTSGKSIDINGWTKRSDTAKYWRTIDFKGAMSDVPSSFKASYLYGATIDDGKLYIHNTSEDANSIVANLNDGSFEVAIPPYHSGGDISDSDFFDSENAVYKFSGANNRPYCGHSEHSGYGYALANKNDRSVVNIPAAAGYPMLGDSKVAIMDVGVPYGSNAGSSKSEDNFLGVKIYSYEGKELSRYPIDGLACYANDSGCDKGISQTDIKAYPVSFAAEGNGFRVVTSSKPNGKGKINTYLLN